MRYYDPKRRDNPGDFFPMPKAVFRLGLDYGEIALLCFLMYCEDRKTFQCHPSYATIGSAIGMSNNTVRKYVDSLEKKGFIYTEPTMVRTRDGRAHNGSLQYTLQPIKPLEEAYFEKQIREAEARARFNRRCKNSRRKEVNLMKQSMYKNRDEMPMFLTVMDVANLLGISRASAYELVREDNFPKLKIVQGRTIIPRDRLLEWLDEQTRYDELPR